MHAITVLNSAELELMHYASANYDPVKAHEYYLKNRELKERKAAETSSLSTESRQKQAEAQAYSKNEISTKKTAELETQKTEVDTALAALQATAEEAATRIQKRLEDYLASVQTQLKIPANASPKVRAFLEKQQAKQSATAKASARADLQNLGKNLRASITNAREQYQAARTATLAKYKTMAETEDQNIRNEVR